MSGRLERRPTPTSAGLNARTAPDMVRRRDETFRQTSGLSVGQTTPLSPLRYLPASALERVLPDVDRQRALVAAAYRAIRDDTCQTPATPEIAPRASAFAHALPAYVADGDITSLKWISGNRENPARGLPYLSGLIVVNDSETGFPVAIMDSAIITAARTAAASAVCVEAFASRDWSTVAVIGYGVQARAHVEALSRLNAAATFQVRSRRASPADDPRISFTQSTATAVRGADVVVTGVPLGATLQPQISFADLEPGALVLPLDDDASIAADVAGESALFLVDDLDDFSERQAAGSFAGWRQPDGRVPDAVVAGRPADGLIVCANQGMGVLDAVFAREMLDAAESCGAGVILDR